MKRLELHPQPACTVDGWTRHACEVRRLNGDTLQSSHSLWFDLSPEAPAWDDTDAEPDLIAGLMLAMHEGRSRRAERWAGGAFRVPPSRAQNLCHGALPAAKICRHRPQSLP